MNDKLQPIRAELEKMKTSLRKLETSTDETCRRQAKQLEIEIRAVEKQLALLEKTS
jgi:predicted  nucleic acid-binding Zn-ribbon protein